MMTPLEHLSRNDRLNKFFIDGQWVEPSGAAEGVVVNPATEEVVSPVSARKQRGCGRGRCSGPPGIRRLEPDHAEIPRGSARSSAGAARGAQRIARTMSEPRNGRGDRICAHCAGAPGDRPCEGRQRGPGRLHLHQAARSNRYRPRTDRCLRTHYSVELAALPDHRQSFAGARGRLHGRTEAKRAFSFGRPAVR